MSNEPQPQTQTDEWGDPIGEKQLHSDLKEIARRVGKEQGLGARQTFRIIRAAMREAKTLFMERGECYFGPDIGKLKMVVRDARNTAYPVWNSDHTQIIRHDQKVVPPKNWVQFRVSERLEKELKSAPLRKS